ncbi:MAG: acylneuraminate cytidylyltransferase [Chloroflexi bacterium]|nr:acylneuraminate cytidylyltransferase [Chloroflexota bacterium]
MSDLEVLAVVPARGGSRSIPRKNIKPFAGHPLMAYSIAAGLQSNSVTRVIASTDDEEIAEVARNYGAEVPFLRPAELAQDHTTDLPVFQHALDWLRREEEYVPEIVVQLRPTSPIRPLDCVDRAVEILMDHAEADSVRGVVPSGQNPYKMWVIQESGSITPLINGGPPEAYNRPRQELPPTYWQTGHIDAIRAGTITEQASMTGGAILPLVLDARYAIDIDTLEDWKRGEQLVQQAQLDMVRPGQAPRPLPDIVELLVLDFDGVLTDDRVWVNARGEESVAAHRGDGYGLGQLRRAGLEMVVISREENKVVAARCEKLGIPVMQGIEDKASALREVLDRGNIESRRAVYVGNDVNDLPCFPLVGCAVAVADAHPQVLAAADMRLSLPGGHGAVRELCDQLLGRVREKERND